MLHDAKWHLIRAQANGRVSFVWTGSKSFVARASRPATFGSRRLRSYLPFHRCAHENSGKDSTAVCRRRRGDVDRLGRAAVSSPVEPSRRFRSDSARQTDVRAGISVNASSSRSSSTGRLNSPVTFPANFRFRIRPLPYSCRDTRWHRRHHQSSSSSDICFFAFAPGAPSDTFPFGDGGFSTSRWKTTSTPSRTNPSFSRFGLSAMFGIAMLPTTSSAPLFTQRPPASSDDSQPRRTGMCTAPGRLHPADRQCHAK
ncbi:hypothetical protein P3T25_005513 [Paraburkholderia sp. GAS32]